MTSCSSASTEDGDDYIQPDVIDDSTNAHTRSSLPSISKLQSRPSSKQSGRLGSIGWAHSHVQNGHDWRVPAQSPSVAPPAAMSFGSIDSPPTLRRFRQGSKIVSPLVVVVASLGWALLFVIVRSLLRHGLEHKGCHMSYMRPSYVHHSDFGTEYTRFATKYSLYLYREQGIDDDQLRGTPVLFIPGNAGSYKQVRPIAAEAANYYHNNLRDDGNSMLAGVRNLDFFTVDFNEDITAFHGRTLLDQAEYLNEAVRYILSLYSDPQRAARDNQIPDPSAVVILGHSMGGVVARAMLTQPNYQSKSINSIITMAAPHARPPVTFDAQIVHIYDEINGYWRRAYAQKWANDNPLWHVTLVSIAGGSLDTVVPSDYASLESIVPETHGFTVFTSGIPTVWTSMDHQAILCHTKDLTPTSYLIPVPPPDLLGTKRFTFITDASLDLDAAEADLEVLLCSVIPNALDLDGDRSPTHLGLAAGSTLFERLSCKSSAPDAIFLPAQSRSANAGDEQPQAQPYTYLQYGPEHLTDHQFIVVRVLSEMSAFVLAEFSDARDFKIQHNATLAQLVTEGLVFDLQPDRPLVVDVSIMSAASALLVFKLEISVSRCSGKRKMPTLIRQFLNKPYESKYFVNTRQASIWSDPICESPLTARLRLDIWASFGKLYMRYRTILAAFPLLVEAMVLRKQFRVYDETGIFISFTQVLLFLVSTIIPYQFAYVVACLVQIFTVICAFRISTKLASVDSQNFYHYAHSILLLMMWVLPINLPILAVWVRNLAVHWLTPFPSHHNVFCIIPFMLLVENLTAGSMVPQMRSWQRHVTNLVLIGTAFCVAIYGVSHAYALHYLVNAVAAWLVYLHSTRHA
ncbi:hypothetical protein CDD80_6688 [Ophiocordyceps camponoti-rufipedis]|uniref:GPI inositol-deacylase n=1 Tax=Ophiocordyceps camponoti-rufipedis TaxID=2004952 RepID=A0A2C5YPH3_9HYPO|nr:hypothetical protein CDD80_6688 [Ophiocordyceps camponoti-rufipedis]